MGGGDKRQAMVAMMGQDCRLGVIGCAEGDMNGFGRVAQDTELSPAIFGVTICF